MERSGSNIGKGKVVGASFLAGVILLALLLAVPMMRTTPSSDVPGVGVAHGAYCTEEQLKLDIRPPDVYPNTVDLTSSGDLPVALYSPYECDVPCIDPETVTFAGARPSSWTIVDVNNDGNDDILFQFGIPGLNLQSNSTQGVMIGETCDGRPFEVSDMVSPLP